MSIFHAKICSPAPELTIWKNNNLSIGWTLPLCPALLYPDNLSYFIYLYPSFDLAAFSLQTKLCTIIVVDITSTSASVFIAAATATA